MNKINILKTYFFDPYINYNHEIKIRDIYCELFIYENNNNYYTLHFYTSNNTYYSYYKTKQVTPNYIIFYGININENSLIRIKNSNYIQINNLGYCISYTYDLEYEYDLKIKKIDEYIFIKYYKNIFKLKRGIKIYDALKHCIYNHKYNVHKYYITYYINYYIYIYNYNYKEYNSQNYNTILYNYSRHFMIII